MAFYKLVQTLPLPSPATFTSGAIGFVTVVIFCFFFNKRVKGGGRLPPGPFPWPIIGNLLQLSLPAHRTLTDLAHKYGPIMFLRFGSVPTVVVSSSEMAKHFLKTHDLIFASRPPTAAGKYVFYDFKDVLFVPYGDHWRQLRKLCVTELLSAKRIESFKHVRDEEICMMMRSIWEESERGTVAVNMSMAATTLTSSIAWRILASRKISGDHELDASGQGFKDLMSELSATLGVLNIGDFIPFLDRFDLQGVKRRMKKVSKLFDELAEKIIDDHLNNHRVGAENIKDFVDVLLEMKATESNNTYQIKITREIIKAVILDMFAGGTDTSAITIEWALSELLRHPHSIKILQEEIDSVIGEHGKVMESDLSNMKFLRCVVKETLRLYPPAPLAAPHECEEAVTIGGYYIPKKTMLMVNLWAIGRDPNVWGGRDAACEFMPERFMAEEHIDLTGGQDFRMLPFGAGRRGCPGSQMAIPMIELALARLFHEFDWRYELGDPSQMDMTEAHGISIARQVPLLAVPRLRLPQPTYLSI